MTCPECGAGRPRGVLADLLELAHMRPGCSLGASEDAKRLTDQAAAFDLGLPAFDRPVSAAELTLLRAAAVDVSEVTVTRVRMAAGCVRRREWPGARYAG